MLRRLPGSRVVFATMRTGALIAGLVAMLALAGCGGEDESPPEPGDPGGAPLTGPLTYSRGGGIGGRMDKLTVRPDGSGTLVTKTGERAVELQDRELEALADDVERADLPGLPADSTADRPQPDALGYRVVYGDATVTTESGKVPERMAPLLATLDGIVDRLGAK
jgi:hypothetical protein